MDKIEIFRKADEGFKNYTQKEHGKNIYGCFAFIKYIVPYALRYNRDFKSINRKKEKLNSLQVDPNKIVFGRNFRIIDYKIRKRAKRIDLKVEKINKKARFIDFIEIPLSEVNKNVELVDKLEKEYQTEILSFNRSEIEDFMLNEIIITI